MSQSKRFMPISASSGSIYQMLDAFENKLHEVGGGTDIQASYDPMFRDTDGGFGKAGETYKYSELKQYWDDNHDSDPVLEEYKDFNTWFKDTKNNYLEEVDDVEGCGAIQGATIHDMLDAFESKLDELGASTSIQGSADVDDQIWDIANRYVSSRPLSGSWDTEDAHFLRALMDEVGLSEGEAKSAMIKLGYDPRTVYQLEPLKASTTIQGATNSDDLSDEYINNLMEEVTDSLGHSYKTDYEVDSSHENITLTSISKDDIIIEYTIPLADLKGDIKTDSKYILDAIES